MAIHEELIALAEDNAQQTHVEQLYEVIDTYVTFKVDFWKYCLI